ncbi:glycosyltransferase [uncultured Algoriphagus sp.]|uniref:glycosyltransferase n=1 Tax=uncultured Algoriphagus sp. TaxID=417365 RepID=UPI002585E03E|nr:glycosyltransferase [uncultured Algoriphagus sp.]
MKIVRVVSELDFGGVEQVIANSVPNLFKSSDVELSILVLGKGGRISNYLIENGIPVNIWNRRVRIPNFSLLFQLQNFLRNYNPDVVHCQGSEANFHGILAAKFGGVPRIIGEEIGIPNHHSFWKWIFRIVYKQAHQVIAISEAVKREIVGLGEVSEEKVKVIYNPVDSEGRENRDQGNQKREFEGEEKGYTFNFVTTCRLVPIKNLERLIQAFGGLVKANPDRELRLRIVGEGPERENIDKEIRDKGLVSRVEILGFQSNVWAFLEESDVFVLPSLREGSSVSLAEAMTVGLPSIVTQVGGASEVLGDSNSGIFIDPLDIDSIQGAMQQMIDFSKEEREAMGARAKKEAQRFSVDNYIKELMKIYHSPIS